MLQGATCAASARRIAAAMGRAATALRSGSCADRLGRSGGLTGRATAARVAVDAAGTCGLGPASIPPTRGASGSCCLTRPALMCVTLVAQLGSRRADDADPLAHWTAQRGVRQSAHMGLKTQHVDETAGSSSRVRALAMVVLGLLLGVAVALSAFASRPSVPDDDFLLVWSILAVALTVTSASVFELGLRRSSDAAQIRDVHGDRSIGVASLSVRAVALMAVSTCCLISLGCRGVASS